MTAKMYTFGSFNASFNPEIALWRNSDDANAWKYREVRTNPQRYLHLLLQRPPRDELARDDVGLVRAIWCYEASQTSQ